MVVEEVFFDVFFFVVEGDCKVVEVEVVVVLYDVLEDWLIVDFDYWFWMDFCFFCEMCFGFFG